MKRRRRVTRWLIAPALLLIGGAIVNVAVALLFGITNPGYPPLHNLPDEHVASLLQSYIGEAVNAEDTFGLVHEGVGWTYLYCFSAMWNRPRTCGLRRLDGGLPALSLRSETLFRGSVTEHVSGIAIDSEAAFGSVPTRPIWPGFAINTLFYAAILWLLFAVPFALRRKRRRKRGLCPACAYPIGVSDVCTECGRAVTPRSSEAAT